MVILAALTLLEGTYPVHNFLDLNRDIWVHRKVVASAERVTFCGIVSGREALNAFVDSQ